MSNQLSNGLLGRRRRIILAAPVNLTVPVISGTPTVGQVLSATLGTWSGNPSLTYSRQWKRDGANISGETGATYTIVSADAGTTITCTVTAANEVGTAGATSAGVTVAPLLSEIEFIDSATNNLGSSVTCPATQEGDILIFAQGQYPNGGGTPTAPSGFTLTQVATSGSGIRSLLSHKVATGAEGGTSLSGVGANSSGVIIFVFRGNEPVNGIIANNFDGQTAGTEGGTSRTIPSGSSSSKPLIAFGMATIFGGRGITFSPQTQRVNLNSNTAAASYHLQNETLTNVSHSTGSSSPGGSAVVNGYYTFTA